MPSCKQTLSLPFINSIIRDEGWRLALNVLPGKLKSIRQYRGWTQRQVAKKMHISPSSIALYETGDRNPDPQMLKRLADLFDCSVDWLLGRVDLEDFQGIRKMEILAAHRQDDPLRNLPAEALRSLQEFQDFIISKYSK